MRRDINRRWRFKFRRFMSRRVLMGFSGLRMNVRFSFMISSFVNIVYNGFRIGVS